MSGDIFNLIADRVFGTNISGMNEKPRKDLVSVPLSEFERGNKIIQEHSSLLQKYQTMSESHKQLHDELNRVRAKLEGALIDARVSNSAVEGLFKLIGHEDARISSEKKAGSFVRTQFFQLVKKFGFEDGVNIDFVRKNVNLQQKFSFNIYMIAAADYMMIQSYLATLIAALGEVIDDAKKSVDSPFFGKEDFIKNLEATKNVLVDDLISVSRLDSNAFKSFHRNRVQELVAKVKFIPGTSDIDPNTIPPISAGEIDDTLNKMQAIHIIKKRIQDEEVVESLSIENMDTLIPSAYHVDKFNIKGWTL